MKTIFTGIKTRVGLYGIDAYHVDEIDVISARSRLFRMLVYLEKS
jgi:hypothetical protein